MDWIGRLVVGTLVFGLGVGFAAAQTTPAPDTLKADYFSNANSAGFADGTVRITNDGESGGDLCAAIYVYDSMQELSECCSCQITPNGLRTLSVDTDLTKNPLTGVTLTTGSIRIVSTAEVGGSCPSLPYKVTPVAGMRAWVTHIQNNGKVTETTFAQNGTLSSGELTILENDCYAIALTGSGGGLCSCGTGDQGT